MEEPLEVRSVPKAFYIKFSDGSKAFLTYEVEGGVMKLTATYTPLSTGARAWLS